MIKKNERKDGIRPISMLQKLKSSFDACTNR